ncbi:hypothetical protein HN51_018157 [Arachis hypogaea]
MNFPIILLLLFFFSLKPPQKHVIVSSTTQDTCLDAVCNLREPVIRFPFQIEPNSSSSSCGYPGFTVTCNNRGQTLLNLPHSGGEFSIKGIDYDTQQVWVNDPDNCLPKRILSLNLSSSPFEAVYNQEFTFFNCSMNLEYLKHRYNPIACLSDPKHMLFATSSSTVVVYLSSICNVVKRVKVPVGVPFYEHVVSSNLSDDLRLSWEWPECGRCESHGGRCGFESNTTSHVVCFNDFPSKGFSRCARYAIAIGLGVPALLCFIGILSCLCSKLKILAHRWVWDRQTVPDFEPLISPQPTIILGLDGPTIESYPKMVVGESPNILPKPNDNTCPICLSEYKPKETVKRIPECLHCFHAQCIDEWLPLNASCPICRTSPNKLPAAA